MVGDASKRRLFAAVFDNALALLVAVLPAAKLPGLPDTLRWTMAGVIYLLVFLIQEGLWSTTAGKRLLGLMIVRADGSPASWREASIRTVMRVLEVNPVLAGGLPAGLTIMFSKKRKRLGDMLAKSVVVSRHARSSH